jgi:hypothetical protein
MADGSLRAVEMVEVGDEVMGPDSLPRRVIRRFAGEAQLYHVRQANADDYTVTGNHLLAMRRRGNCAERYPQIGDFMTVPANEMMGRSKKFLECFGGYIFQNEPSISLHTFLAFGLAMVNHVRCALAHQSRKSSNIVTNWQCVMDLNSA